MAEARQIAFFSDEPSSLDMENSEAIINFERYKKARLESAYKDIASRNDKEGPAVPLKLRWETMQRMLEIIPEESRLKGLLKKDSTDEGRKEIRNNRAKQRLKKGLPPETIGEYLDFIANSKSKSIRLSKEMLGHAAILTARDDLIAFGYENDISADRHHQMLSAAFRKKYSDPKKRAEQSDTIAVAYEAYTEEDAPEQLELDD